MKVPTTRLLLVDEALPVPDKRVVVICSAFRCLGYIQRGGTWRDNAADRELKDVVAWHPLQAEQAEGRWG